MAEKSDWDAIKGLSAPARRALANAGHTTIKDLTKVTEKALGELHGMGPKAVTALKDALKEMGLGFKK
jgi:DNA-directed RNA polymerase alpha subunit